MMTRTQIKDALGEHPDLNLHLVAAHANPMALRLTAEEASAAHDHEHAGPGTIRHHPAEDRSWDADKVVDVLVETAQDEEHPDHVLAGLLTRPDTTVAMAADEHAHDFSPGGGWTVCAEGAACRSYPRTYDARQTYGPDGEAKGCSYGTITTPEDDIARGLLAARAALTISLAVATDPSQPIPRLAHEVRTALTQLDNTIGLTHERIYPESDPR